jgi:hypothetical protein
LIERPEAPVDEKDVASLLDAAKEVTADDWLEHPQGGTGLEQPVMTLTLTLRDGRTHSLTLGKALGGKGSGHYVSLQGAPGVFVVSDATYQALTEALGKLQS